MQGRNPHAEPDDALARRAEDLQSLRQAEQEIAFTGDQREETGEARTVGQHPADVADFTVQRELQQTTQQLLEREAAHIAAAMRARGNGTYRTCHEAALPIPPESPAAR